MGEHRDGNVIRDDYGRQIAVIQNGKRIAVKGAGVRPIKSRIFKSKKISHEEIKRRAAKGQRKSYREIVEARRKALREAGNER